MCRCPIRSPPHSLRNAGAVNGHSSVENILGYSVRGKYVLREQASVSYVPPKCMIECQLPWRDQLLQRPSPKKPFTRYKGSRSVNIIHICVTAFGVMVPLIHGINHFRKFAAAAFINAACVHPAPLKAIRLCLRNAGFGLLEPFPLFRYGERRGHLFETDFFMSPSMGKDGGRRNIVPAKLGKLKSRNINRSHRVGSACQAWA